MNNKFSLIRTEYGDLQSKSLYSVRRGKIRSRKTPNLDTFYAVSVTQFCKTSNKPNTTPFKSSAERFMDL